MAIHWNTEKLNHYLARIDTAIAEGRYQLAVRLANRCLRQYYRAFIEENNIPVEPMRLENIRLMALSICRYLNSYFRQREIPYSERRLIFISLASHFIFLASMPLDQDATSAPDKAMAMYARENLNEIICYLSRYFT